MDKGKQGRGKRQAHGQVFKDVGPLQKRLRERRSKLEEIHEVPFVGVLPILSPPRVVNVCRVHFVITHIPQDKISVDILNIYLSNLSLLNCSHICLKPELCLSKNCVCGCHRTGTHYWFVSKMTKVWIHTAVGVTSNEKGDELTPWYVPYEGTGNIHLCRSWFERQRQQNEFLIRLRFHSMSWSKQINNPTHNSSCGS